MIDHMYTIPVYTRTLQFAYMHRRDWGPFQSKGRKWLQENVPMIDLGTMTGKTTAAVNYADQFSDVIIITPSATLADNITRRHSTVRAFGQDHLDRLNPDHFKSTQPLFVFDDTSIAMTLDVLVKFRPERFIHLGVWG